VGTQPRDYYVIEDEQGRRYWIYREGLYGETGEAQPKWFVHGLSA
jgi:protein ImuB